MNSSFVLLSSVTTVVVTFYIFILALSCSSKSG